MHIWKVTVELTYELDISQTITSITNSRESACSLNLLWKVTVGLTFENFFHSRTAVCCSESSLWAHQVVCEWETEEQRDRETERQRDRETERQRDRETERQRDRETEKKHPYEPIRYTATHCNTLQHTATHCNTYYNILQHTATHCNTLQHTATHYTTCYNILQHTITHHILQHTTQQATKHCNTP